MSRLPNHLNRAMEMPMKKIFTVFSILVLLVACNSAPPPTGNAELYVISSSELYQVSFSQGQPERLIGKLQDAQGSGIILLDLALSPTDGQLYGVNNTLYSVKTPPS